MSWHEAIDKASSQKCIDKELEPDEVPPISKEEDELLRNSRTSGFTVSLDGATRQRRLKVKRPKPNSGNGGEEKVRVGMLFRGEGGSGQAL